MRSVVAVVPTLARDIRRLEASLSSVREHTRHPGLTVVVVNNSGEPLAQPLPHADRVVTPGLNLGYVGSLEYVRRAFPADFLWSVQDDMTLSNDVLAHLLAAVQADPLLAAASPILVRDGVVPRHTRAGIFADDTRTRWTNYPFEDTAPEDIDTDLDWCFVSGSGALYRSTALEDIGGFDLDLYPLTNVDVDVSLRLVRGRHRLALVPTARITHEVRGSTTKMLAHVLYRRHTPLVHAKLERDFADLPPLPVPEPPVPEDIRDAIARRASHLFIEVAREADSRIIALNAQIADLRSQRLELTRENKALRKQETALRRDLECLRGSTASRLSAPMRGLVGLVRKGLRGK
ncbi:MAG: hypothetical protein RL330_863 [Actinomycetota bacterium]|jgi:GT2 family glycosyltransferase